MNETGVLMEYEQILLGNTINSRSKFTATYISKNADDRYALHLLRYVFEEILDWSPIVTRTFLSGELIDMLKLRVVANSIQFPPEFHFFLPHPKHSPLRMKESLFVASEQVLDTSE